MAKKILVVDDTPENLSILTEILTRQGYKVRSASSGSEALAIVQKELPDLILLDVLMPNMDGYEVCRYLKTDGRTREIPIIFISALDSHSDKMNAFSAGGVDYITRPFKFGEVLARVKTHLTMRQLQDELEAKNEALKRANDNLEEKVKARTAELAAANDSLHAEIAQRERHQQEKDKLLDVVRQQSEQLRRMMNWLIESRQEEREGLAQALHDQMVQSLTMLSFNLDLIHTLVADMEPEQSLPAHEVILTHLKDSRHILVQTRQYMNQVTDDLSQPPTNEQELLRNPLLNLSSREREVLQLLVDGKTNPEIADILNLSLSTAQTYRTRIMRKLNLDTLADLIKFALKHGLSPLE